MLFYVTHEGKEHRVRVETRRNRLYVTFDDEAEERIDLHFHGNDCSFIREHQVFYGNVVGQKSDYTLWDPARSLNFKVESEYKRIVNKLRGQSAGEENKITAKMPGKIVRIMAKVGDEVKAGQAVLVMEAMKMENEIKASSPGKIKKIFVKTGAAVESGAPLIEINPAKK